MREFVLSRRGLLVLAGAGTAGRLFGYAADFWNKKPPAEWSAEEMDRLVTDSPWAKPVTAEYSGEADAPSDQDSAPGSRGSGPWGEGIPTGGPGGQSGPITIGGIPGVGLPRLPGGGQPRRRKGASQYRGTVLWESAKPIQDALKTPLPDVFDNHYAISVNGVPLSSGAGDGESAKEDIDGLKRYATLQPKGKQASEAAVVRREVGNGSILIFGFRRDAPALGPDDKDVRFEARLGGLLVKARFNPKEMLYQGKLAL